MTDIRLAVRALVATPVVTAAAIASLMLGIGLNTAIFSLVNSLLIRTLPVAAPDRLAMLTDANVETRAWSNPLWEQIRARGAVYDGAFAWSHAQFNLARGGEAQLVEGIWASGDFFDVLGVPASQGRTFGRADDRRGGGVDGPVAVISHDFWQRQYGESRNAIGQSLTLNGVAFSVIGVTPQGFFGPDVGQRFDVILPLGAEPLLAGANSGLDLRGRHWLNIMVRQRPDQPLEAAVAAWHGIQKDLQASLPSLDAGFARDLQTPLTLIPAATGRSPLRSRYRQALMMLLVVSAGLLLIACVNIANLMMARAVARRREMSLRMALGASRARLGFLLLTEAIIMSGTGALLAIGVAQLMSRFIVRQIATPGNAVYFDLAPDWRVWGFAAAAASITGILFGIAPAWHSMRADPIDALREQGRGSVGGGRSHWPAALVTVQVALSLVLVAAAGVFARTSAELSERNLGTWRDRVLLVNITAPMTRYTLESLVPVYDQVLERISALPGVERAANSDVTPASGAGRTSSAEIPGLSQPAGISVNVISPGWVHTYGLRLVAGRDLQSTDRTNTPPVVLVNEAFTRMFFGGANPVGRTVRVGLLSGMTNVEIVGLVEDAVYRSMREETTPVVYSSTTQRTAARPFVNVSVLAARGQPSMLSRSIEAEVRAIDPELVLRFVPLTTQMNASMAQERLVALLSGAFGALALALAAVGLYGVTAYSVTRRKSEIAMRMALGAGRFGVMGLVLRRIGTFVGAGIALGCLVSLWAARFAETLVWGLEPRDPATFVAAAATLGVVAGASAGLPVWRASRINPARVLAPDRS
jgi:putative ABC transport system permease protein